MKEDILFREVPVNYFIRIFNKENNLQNNLQVLSISRITIKSDFDLQYCYHLINIFVNSDLLIKERIDGRSFGLELTNKGKELVNGLIEIKNLLKEEK